MRNWKFTNLEKPSQSGTIVAGMGTTALEDQILNVLKIDNNDFASRVEMWVLLETESAKLAALRRTDQDISAIKKALDVYANKVKLGKQAAEEDLLFHLKIEEANKNAVLKSFMLIFRSDLINNFFQWDIFKKDSHITTVLDDHEVILGHIIAKKPEKAATAMGRHLNEVFVYCQSLKN